MGTSRIRVCLGCLVVFISITSDSVATTITTVEERLAGIEAKLETFATREDLQKLRADLLSWIVGTILAGIAASSTLTIALQNFFGSRRDHGKIPGGSNNRRDAGATGEGVVPAP